jgi:hypothetical protein
MGNKEDKSLLAYQITDIDGFCQSITIEAFSDAAKFVGKKFFKKTKKDMKDFKDHVIDDKENLLPSDDEVIDELEKYIFSTAEDSFGYYIMPADIEYLVYKLKNAISYNIMSKLTEVEILEMCFSSQENDVIWRRNINA